jgi:hypothetical protein
VEWGWRNLTIVIAPCGSLGWAYALWPFGVWACIVGGLFGGTAGILGARLLARLAERASAEGGRRRWVSVGAVLVALWLALVILPSVVGAVARTRYRPEPRPNQVIASSPGAKTTILSAAYLRTGKLHHSPA